MTVTVPVPVPVWAGTGRARCSECDFEAARPLVEQHIDLVHINPHGSVPADTKGSQVATAVKDTAQPQGAYTEAYPGERQEWIDYLAELKDAIDRGLCDTILKDIARAVFDRRDVMQGKEPGSSFRGATAAPAPNGAAGGGTGGNGAAGQAVAATASANQWEVYDGLGAFVGRIPSVPEQTGVAQFTVNGKTYNKKNLMGKTIRMPMYVNPSYVRNLRVKVVGVGDKRVKVEWVDLPKPGSRYRAAADSGQPTFLGLDTLKDILG